MQNTNNPIDLIKLLSRVAAGGIDEEDTRIEVSFHHRSSSFHITIQDGVRWQTTAVSLDVLIRLYSVEEKIDVVFGQAIRSWKKLNAPPRKPDVPEQYKDWY